MRVWDNGGAILDAKGTTCLLDQGPATDGIQWTADLRLKQQVAPAPADLQGVTVNDAFINGRLAMYPVGVFYQGTAS
jgi:ABC-type glycerol-3-phosphate transport system substrate-binding protein